MSIRAKTIVLGYSFALAFSAHSEVTRFEVLQSEPAYEGRSFGSVGPYVKVTARATVALDPADPRNGIIADLDKAPRNADGRVEATADVVILRPADPQRGNRTLFVDILNRGNKLAPVLFDESREPRASVAEKAGDAGIGFMESRGYTLAWIGWQGDIPSKPAQLAMKAPVLQGVTGVSREEFVFDHTKNPATASLQWPIGDPGSLKVTVRQKWDDLRQTPADLSIRASGPQTADVSRPNGFDAGALYEITYTARDPIVLGMGFATTRDVTSFLRRNTTGANPLVADGRTTVDHAIGFGVSQSGRFLRDFLYLGFNEDLGGGMVFDGLMPHVAGGRRIALNTRFGQPGRNPRHPEDPAWQADTFPFTYGSLFDPVSGRRDGLLQRCTQSATCPRVIQTDSEIEWWSSHASLVVTDTTGRPIDLPPNVRAFMITGTPHFAGPDDRAKNSPMMAGATNPMHSGMPMRALLTAMRSWIVDGVEPPSSRVPMRSQGTLVEASTAVPSGIPGLAYAGTYTRVTLSNTSTMPPTPVAEYPVFVPLADRDGTSIAGLRMLALRVPKATYTGWNQRAAGFGPAALYPLNGVSLPFAATKADREATKDPRLSLEERYDGLPGYVAAVSNAAADMVAERLLLPEDAARAVELAKQDKLSKLR